MFANGYARHKCEMHTALMIKLILLPQMDGWLYGFIIPYIVCGASVFYACVDVCNAKNLREIHRTIREHFMNQSKLVCPSVCFLVFTCRNF